MASSNPRNLRESAEPHDELDEEQLSVTPSLQEDEASLLAHFDRYMRQGEENATPQSSTGTLPASHPFSTFTGQEEPKEGVAATSNEQSATNSTTATSTSSPNGSAPPSADSAKQAAIIRSLAVIFPSYDHDALAAVLDACNGNRRAAIDMLNQSAVSEPAPRANGAAPSAATAADTLRSDAELAARLHRLETAQIRPRRANIPVRLSPPVLGQLVASLREIVVPALRAHFQELTLPDRREESGSLIYELRQLQVAALTLPADNVTVRPAVDRMTVLANVVNANLELEVGQWSYENRGFVPVNDAGRASVSAHGLNIALRLEARRMQGGRTRIVISQCDVTIDGIVRFKTHGAAADWAYNAIAVVFKPWVVSYIKEAVADAVVRALAVHLRQWELAMELDESNSTAPPTSPPTQAPVTASE